MKISKILKKINHRISRDKFLEESVNSTGLTKIGCIKASFEFIRNLKKIGLGKYHIPILDGGFEFALFSAEEGGEYEHIRFYFGEKPYDYLDIYHWAYLEDPLDTTLKDFRIGGNWGMNNHRNGIWTEFRSLEELKNDISKNPGNYGLVS